MNIVLKCKEKELLVFGRSSTLKPVLFGCEKRSKALKFYLILAHFISNHELILSFSFVNQRVGYTFIASTKAFKPSNVSSPVGIICSGGSRKPYRPLSRNSTENEYLTPRLPYVQSSDPPDAASDTNKTIIERACHFSMTLENGYPLGPYSLCTRCLQDAKDNPYLYSVIPRIILAIQLTTSSS